MISFAYTVLLVFDRRISSSNYTDAIQTNCYRYEGDKATFLCSPAPTPKNCTELHPFLQCFDHQSAEQFGHSITLSVFLFVLLHTPIIVPKQNASCSVLGIFLMPFNTLHFYSTTFALLPSTVLHFFSIFSLFSSVFL